ncbi:MAG: DUF1538 domain-containing protein [Clostridia bacterium]|nr:DUF1538 domain-containing protein [Clostridia bacterium]
MKDIKDLFLEVIQAILPIVILVAALLFFLFEKPAPIMLQFLIGAVMIIFGLTLFLLGVKVGLLPLGQLVGSELPQIGSFPLVLIYAFFIGAAVTVAEPNLRVLAYQVGLVTGGKISGNVLITFVAIGVGFFTAVAIARIVLNIPLAYILVAGYLLAFILSAIVPPTFVPIAFDSGGVTTGPLTVPFVLSLGVGFASVLSGKNTLGDSFGYLGLVLLGPIIPVMLLGVIYT